MNWCITAALASFYILALTLKGAAGLIFSLLVLMSLITIVSRRTVSGKSFWQITKLYWPINMAMAAPVVAVLANLLSNGHFIGKSIDQPSRFAFFALIFWVVLLVPLKQLKQMQWAFIIGAFLSAIKMYVLTDGATVRYGTDFIPIIIFAEMAMLLGFFAAFSISWNSRGGKTVILLKLLAACSVVYGAYISASRGTWVTIPVFGVIAYIAAKDLQFKYKVLAAAMLVIALGVASQFSNVVQARIAAGESDIQKYTQGTELDTSLGVRFQLWRGSWILFKENPLFGVGIEGYRDALKDLSARKIITPYAATFPHSHNEILFALARLGLFGLLAILAVYFVPAYYFWREIRHDDREIRGAAAMGLSLCLGVLTLGLTDVVFLWWEIFPFYVISIALFMAYIVKRKESAQEHSEEPVLKRVSEPKAVPESAGI